MPVRLFRKNWLAVDRLAAAMICKGSLDYVSAKASGSGVRPRKDICTTT